MFEPNTKVVCIDGKFPMGIEKLYTTLPKEGAIYTVRDIVPGNGFNCKETVAVYLAECVNPTNRHGIEYGFQCYRFRELEEIRDSFKKKKKQTEPTKKKDKKLTTV